MSFYWTTVVDHFADSRSIGALDAVLNASAEADQVAIRVLAALDVERELMRRRAELAAIESRALLALLIRPINDMIETVWEGGEMDGAYLQDKLVSWGILQVEEFDPIVHADVQTNAEFEPGDDLFLLAPRFIALRDSLREPEPAAPLPDTYGLAAGGKL